MKVEGRQLPPPPRAREPLPSIRCRLAHEKMEPRSQQEPRLSRLEGGPYGRILEGGAVTLRAPLSATSQRRKTTLALPALDPAKARANRPHEEDVLKHSEKDPKAETLERGVMLLPR